MRTSRTGSIRLTHFEVLLVTWAAAAGVARPSVQISSAATSKHVTTISAIALTTESWILSTESATLDSASPKAPDASDTPLIAL